MCIKSGEAVTITITISIEKKINDEMMIMKEINKM